MAAQGRSCGEPRGWCYAEQKGMAQQSLGAGGLVLSPAPGWLGTAPSVPFPCRSKDALHLYKPGSYFPSSSQHLCEDISYSQLRSSHPTLPQGQTHEGVPKQPREGGATPMAKLGSSSRLRSSPSCSAWRWPRLLVDRAWVQQGPQQSQACLWGEQDCSLLVQLPSSCLSNCHPDPVQCYKAPTSNLGLAVLGSKILPAAHGIHVSIP